MTGSFLTPFLLLLELVLLLAVLFVIVRDVCIWRLVVMAIVRRRRLAGAIQPRKLGGADLLRAGGASHAPWVLSPALLSRAAAGGQEALSHGCSALITPLAGGTSPLHFTPAMGRNMRHSHRQIYYLFLNPVGCNPQQAQIFFSILSALIWLWSDKHWLVLGDIQEF